MIAVIIAAGGGSRLAKLSDCKPLTFVLGRPLIAHVVTAINAVAEKCGIDGIEVVTGWNGDQVEKSLRTIACTSDLPVTTSHNADWPRGNGTSVLAARRTFEKPFFLLMADHLIDPNILVRLAATDPQDSGLRLAVDFDLDNRLVDLEDVTRVRCHEGSIVDIGKHLSTYNAFDTGCFLASADLRSVLQAVALRRPTCGISDGVLELAKQGSARVVDIGAAMWMDIDTPEMVEIAEREFNIKP
ncbi:MAG: NTP transferase domain-containing protein [Alphaproteobacteria bacterium]|nr:NTP transferase domain-containing protein [Alphaproteobacteria bacterium]